MSERNPPAEPASFEHLYAEHAPLVRRLVRRLGVAEPERGDVAQEIWLDVHQSLLLYDPSKGSPRAWICGITCNAARDWQRTRRRRSELAQPTDQEPPDLQATGAEATTAEARQREALWSFVRRAIPNEDQRVALLLHEIEGMTVEEVAQATEAKLYTAQMRIKMARSKLKKAAAALGDEERERMRAVILPLGGVDGILRALRETETPVSDDELTEVWDRVVERIEARGGSIHDRLGGPVTPPSLTPLRRYTFTGTQMVGAFVGVFLLGAISGAGALYAFLSSRDSASVTTIDADIAPPLPVQAPPPEPAPSASASAAPSVHSVAAPREPEMGILGRARAALLGGSPDRALEQADRHALLYPRSSFAAEREQIAIRALVKLDRRVEAEERAAKLVRWAPQMQRPMESLLGTSFF